MKTYKQVCKEINKLSELYSVSHVKIQYTIRTKQFELKQNTLNYLIISSIINTNLIL